MDVGPDAYRILVILPLQHFGLPPVLSRPRFAKFDGERRISCAINRFRRWRTEKKNTHGREPLPHNV